MASATASVSRSDIRPDNGLQDAAREQVRGSSLFLIGNVISLAVTFIPHLVLVRYLSTPAYGHWSYALSLVAVGKTYALGFNEAMSRFVPIYHAKRDISRMVGTVIVIFAVTLLISGIVLGGVSADSDLFLRILTKGKESGGLLFLLMFLVPLESFDLLLVNLLACFNRARAIFWCRYIIPSMLRATAITLLVLTRSDLRFLASAYLGAEGITLLIVGTIIYLEWGRDRRRHCVARVQLPVREIMNFQLPLVASNMLGMLGSSIPVLLLGYFHPISTVAYYRVVLPAASMSSMIPATFMALYVPSTSRLFEKGNISGVNNLFWNTSAWMSVLAFPFFLTCTCLARPLTILLYGARYAASAPVLAVLSLGYFISVAFAFNGVTLKVLGQVRLIVVLNLLTSLIIVALNVVLIPHYGVMGAALGTTSGLIAQVFLRQLGLWHWGGGIRLFDKQYASVFGILASGSVCMFLIERFASTNFYVDLLLVAIATLIAIWLARDTLHLLVMFPELLTVPIAGRWLRKSEGLR